MCIVHLVILTNGKSIHWIYWNFLTHLQNYMFKTEYNKWVYLEIRHYIVFRSAFYFFIFLWLLPQMCFWISVSISTVFFSIYKFILDIKLSIVSTYRTNSIYQNVGLIEQYRKNVLQIIIEKSLLHIECKPLCHYK